MNKILAIDDQQDNLTTLKALLKLNMPECAVLTTLSGEEGLAIAAKEQPDTILLDIIMPNMDGYEVCNRLKKNKRTKNIPVLMLTAIRTDIQSRVKGLSIGADAFLYKPIDSVELTAQLNVMLRIKRAEDKLRAEKLNLEEIVLERTKELRKSEENRKLFMNSATDNFTLWSADLCLLDINCNALNLFPKGTEKKEILGKRMIELDPNIKKLGKYDKYLDVIKTGIPFYIDEYTTKIVKEDIYLSLKAFKAGDGMGMIISDITERKHAEQIQKLLYNISNAVSITNNLKELILLIKTELGNIIDTTNFYIALYNKEDNMLEFPFYSDRKDMFTSISAEKTLTKYVIDTKKSLLANNDVKKELIKKGLLENKGSISKIWLGVPLKIEDEVIGVLTVQSYTDENAYGESDMKILEFISDQVSLSINKKKTEDELIIALEKAKESDRLKSAFLANMSHEIRTPMNGILGFSSLLKQSELSEEKRTFFISIIDKSGHRLLNIINNLINISKIESGQMKVHISEVNINEQIEEIYNLFKPESEEKGIKLYKKNVLISQQAIINSDSDKINSILSNLVKNAIKYTHKGSIEFGYSLKRASKQDDTELFNNELFASKLVEPFELEFYVKDTGIGIPKDRQEAIFERFIQADIEDRQAYEGAGLGLAISKAYVEMLDGNIWLESEEGKGSKFFFTVPYNSIKQKGKKEKNKSKKSESKQNNLKILIVEDEETSDLLLNEMVENISREKLHAKNGIEAVEICKKNKDIDLIFMDMKMPVLNGYDATREIRNFNKDVVIVAQTAFVLAGDREKAIEAGCNEYMSKPIMNKILLEIVEKYLY